MEALMTLLYVLDFLVMHKQIVHVVRVIKTTTGLTLFGAKLISDGLFDGSLNLRDKDSVYNYLFVISAKARRMDETVRMCEIERVKIMFDQYYTTIDNESKLGS